jgi:mannose-6-phosphate isomerase-like protein (cupin superfamily)
MPYLPINFADKFTHFTRHWSPRIIAQMNNSHFKLVKIQGEFVWHAHPETDEVFIVIAGQMTIAFRDGELVLRPGEMFVIPKGHEHKPSATTECQIMLVELAGTVNTGDVASDLTAKDGQWI